MLAAAAAFGWPGRCLLADDNDDEHTTQTYTTVEGKQVGEKRRTDRDAGGEGRQQAKEG